MTPPKAPPPERRPRRRWLRRLVVLVLAAVLVAAAPALALRLFGGEIMRRQLEQRLAGGVEVASASGGWIEPLVLRRVAVRASRAPGAPVVAEATEVRLSDGVFGLLFGTDTVGVEVPEATVVLDAAGGPGTLARALGPAVRGDGTGAAAGRPLTLRVRRGLVPAAAGGRPAQFEASLATDLAGAAIRGRATLADAEGGALTLEGRVVDPAGRNPRIERLHFEARSLDLAGLPLPPLRPPLHGRLVLARGSLEEGVDGVLDLAVEARFTDLAGSPWRTPGSGPLAEASLAVRARLGERRAELEHLELAGTGGRLDLQRRGHVSWAGTRLEGDLACAFRLARVEDWRIPELLPAPPRGLSVAGEATGTLSFRGTASRTDRGLRPVPGGDHEAALELRLGEVRVGGEPVSDLQLALRTSGEGFELVSVRGIAFGGEVVASGRGDAAGRFSGTWLARGLCGARSLGLRGDVLLAPFRGAGTLERVGGVLRVSGDLGGSALQWEGRGVQAGRGLYLSDVAVRFDVDLEAEASSPSPRRLELRAREADLLVEGQAGGPQGSPRCTLTLREAAVRSLLPEVRVASPDASVAVRGVLDGIEPAGWPRGRFDVVARALRWRELEVATARAVLVRDAAGTRSDGPVRLEKDGGRLDLALTWDASGGALRQLTADAEAFPLDLDDPGGVIPFAVRGRFTGAAALDAAAGRLEWSGRFDEVALRLEGAPASAPTVSTRGRVLRRGDGALELDAVAFDGSEGLRLAIDRGVWGPGDPPALPRELTLDAALAGPWATLAARLLGAPAVRFSRPVRVDAAWRIPEAARLPQGHLRLEAAEVRRGEELLRAVGIDASLDAERLVLDLRGDLGEGRLTARGALALAPEALREGDRLELRLDGVPWHHHRRAPDAAAHLVLRGTLGGALELLGAPGTGWSLSGHLEGGATTVHRLETGGSREARRVPPWSGDLEAGAGHDVSDWELRRLDLRGEGLALALEGRLGAEAALELRASAAREVAGALAMLLPPSPLVPTGDVRLAGGLVRGAGGAWEGILHAGLARFTLAELPGEDLDLAVRVGAAQAVLGPGRGRLCGGTLVIDEGTAWIPGPGGGSGRARLRAEGLVLAPPVAGALGVLVPPWILDASSPRPVALEGRLDLELDLLRDADSGVRGELKLTAGPTRVVGSRVLEGFARELLGSEAAVTRAHRRGRVAGLGDRLALAARDGITFAPFTADWTFEDRGLRVGRLVLGSGDDLELGIRGTIGGEGAWDLTLVPAGPAVPRDRDAPELRLLGNPRHRGPDGRRDLRLGLR